MKGRSDWGNGDWETLCLRVPNSIVGMAKLFLKISLCLKIIIHQNKPCPRASVAKTFLHGVLQ
jgi:hypothetical protein